MSAEKKSRVKSNLESFWEKNGEKIVKRYEDSISQFSSIKITNGSEISDIDGKTPYQLIANQLGSCRVMIMTANEVEMKTVKRLLYEEATERKIYKFWLKHNHTKNTDEDDICRSRKLLVFNFESEAQYYFITLGATDGEYESDNAIHRQIKIGYTYPQNISSFTANGSHKVVSHAIRRYRDSDLGFYPFIASLGVSFGLFPEIDSNRNNPSKQQLGDVLISKSIIAYDSRYKAEGDEINFKKCEIYPLEQGTNRAFSERFEGKTPEENNHKLVSSTILPAEQELYNNAGLEIYCHYGDLYSGGAVVSSQSFKKKLHDAETDAGERIKDRKPIGGEMEGLGIWYACLLEDDLFPCVVIKGICDWGEGKNDWMDILNDKGKGFFLEKYKKLLTKDLSDFLFIQNPDLDYSDTLFDDLCNYQTQKQELEEEQPFTEIGELLERCVPQTDIINVFQLEDPSKISDLKKRNRVENEINELRKKLGECSDSSRKAVNDLVKDSIQAYATENAFKVFCYILYDDPQLLINPAKTPIETQNQKRIDDLNEMVKRLGSETIKYKQESADLKGTVNELETRLLLSYDQIKDIQDKSEQNSRIVDILKEMSPEILNKIIFQINTRGGK